MTSLATMCEDAEAARVAFETLVDRKFPGLDKWYWYRALAAINGDIGRHNDDTSHDAALAADLEINAAHGEYIRLIHIFYRARDGEHGFLGGRMGAPKPARRVIDLDAFRTAAALIPQAQALQQRLRA